VDVPEKLVGFVLPCGSPDVPFGCFEWLKLMAIVAGTYVGCRLSKDQSGVCFSQLKTTLWL
jgi:hypothetical protein